MLPHEVYCGGVESDSPVANSLHLDVKSSNSLANQVNLSIEKLSRRLAGNIPAILQDLLEIAAYVYCADQFVSRGTPTMGGMGRAWRRQFRFHIPVRKPEIWMQMEVASLLNDALNFMSEDEFQFHFVGAKRPIPFDAYLPLHDTEAQIIPPDEVILFSGGLDSLAGATDVIIGDKRRAALVSHQSSTLLASKQKSLVSVLAARSRPSRVLHIPVTINKGEKDATEFTQRTRSFLFAVLGFIAARMFALNSLRFYENGVVSINLPLADHVLGTRATRTTHPRVLNCCSRLFSVLLADQFEISNPYLWKTKTEVVRVLANRECGDLIRSSFSCARVRDGVRTGKHCGVCSQCVDRRFGILAAGLGECDPAEGYSVDVFEEHIPIAEPLTTVESYVLRGTKLASMTFQTFLASYGQISRILPHLRVNVDEGARLIWDLHARHGHEIRSVLDAQLTCRSQTKVAANSLLSMVAPSLGREHQFLDPVETEPPSSQQAAQDLLAYGWRPIRLAIDVQKKRIVFEKGAQLRGRSYSLVAALAEEYKSDRAQGLLPENHSFVSADDLAERLQIEPATLRRYVSRAREDARTRLFESDGREIEDEDIIENRPWKGYRLNPHLVLVNSAELMSKEANLSQTSEAGVTSSAHHH